jgi:hypothetical protein
MYRALLILWMAAAAAPLYAAPESPASAVAANPARATAEIGLLTQLALRAGSDGTLPPHLVEVLGMGTHVAGLPVRQLVMREGQEVRVFNVSVAKHTDLVILRHDEAARTTAAYRLSAKGTLREAVSYSDGSESRPMSATEAKSRFAAEITYWSAVSHRASAPH